MPSPLPLIFDPDAPQAPPCARCRQTGGYRLPDAAEPRRYDARQYGLAGKVCDRCRQLLARERKSIPSDPAADSWGDEDRPGVLAEDAEDIGRAVGGRRPACDDDGPFAFIGPLPDPYRDWRRAHRSWRARLPTSRAILRAAGVLRERVKV